MAGALSELKLRERPPVPWAEDATHGGLCRRSVASRGLHRRCFVMIVLPVVTASLHTLVSVKMPARRGRPRSSVLFKVPVPLARGPGLVHTLCYYAWGNTHTARCTRDTAVWWTAQRTASDGSLGGAGSTTTLTILETCFLGRAQSTCLCRGLWISNSPRHQTH